MALGDLAFEETGKFAGRGHSPTERWKRPIRNRQIVRCRLFIYLYRRRNPAWRNLDCGVQWNLHNQRWRHCRCVGSWKGATYRKWPKGEAGGVELSDKKAYSPTFARLNCLPGVWELDIDEEGNFHLKVWEWK